MWYVTLYHSFSVITVGFLSSVDIGDFVSIWSSNRIPLSNGGGCGNFVDWWRIVCKVGKSFDWVCGKSRWINFGNVLNVDEVFWKRSLNILFVGLINAGWKLTFFVGWRRFDFRVRVIKPETVDDDDGFGWLCKRSRSDVDDDSPLYGHERSEEENSPSVVDGLVPDRGWEFF